MNYMKFKVYKKVLKEVTEKELRAESFVINRID